MQDTQALSENYYSKNPSYTTQPYGNICCGKAPLYTLGKIPQYDAF